MSGHAGPGCPAVYDQAYPGLVSVFYDALDKGAVPVDFSQHNIDARKVVLWGHSQGGAGAVSLLAGEANFYILCL